MKTPNLKVWTTALRNPDLLQTSGVLGRVAPDGTESYCCLGVGCTLVPRLSSSLVRVGAGWQMQLFGEQGAMTMPPIKFHGWLGLDMGRSRYHTGDVYIDWPEGMTDRHGEELRHLSCSKLNDGVELTFDQIADVLDYFGVADRVVDDRA